MKSAMKTVVIFKWKGKLPTDEEVGADENTVLSDDFGEQFAYRACKPVAESLLKSVRESGYTTHGDTLWEGELGWSFSIIHEGKSYEIFTMWAGIEDQDYFVIQPSLEGGCLFFWLPRPSETALEPVFRILAEALSVNPLVTGIQWLTEKEFNFKAHPITQDRKTTIPFYRDL